MLLFLLLLHINLLHTFMRQFFLYTFILSLLLLAYLSGCQTKNDSSKSRNDADLKHINNVFVRSKPDTWIQTIKDSAKTDAETKLLSINLMNLLNNQPPDVIFQTIEKVDSAFGKHDEVLHGYTLLFRAQGFIGVNRVDTAITLATKSFSLAKTLNDSALISGAAQILGSCYIEDSNFPQALSYFHKALSYNPKREVMNTANIIMELSNVYTRLRNFPKSKDYAAKSVQLLETQKDSMTLASYLTYLSSSYSDFGNGDSALWAAERAFKIASALKDERQYATIYWATGVAYMVQRDYQKALNSLGQALEMSNAQQNFLLSSKINTNIANCYLLMGETEKAKQLYLTTLDEQTKKMRVKANMKICDSLVVVNLKQSGDVFLLNYFRKTRRFIDSIFSAERIMIVEDINIRYETAEKELKIKELAYQKRGLQIQILISLFISALILFVGAWIIYRNRQRSLLLVKENALLESSKQLLETKHHLQEKQMEADKEKLADFIEHVRSKNQIIEEMENRLTTLIQNASGISQDEYEQNKLALMEKKILTDNDWKTYIGHFEKVYPTFTQRLNEVFPNLSQAESRMIVLLHLGLNKNDIANILGISIEGVRKSQYRLRKKYNISENIELEQYLKTL